RGAKIELRRDLAADLAQHLAQRLTDAKRAALRQKETIPMRLGADEPLINISTDPIRLLDRDLLAAGLAIRVRDGDKWRIDKADDRGRTFDIHAFRTTINSLLSSAGVPLTTRRLLMRHAAEGVTDGHYSDVKLI